MKVATDPFKNLSLAKKFGYGVGAIMAVTLTVTIFMFLALRGVNQSAERQSQILPNLQNFAGNTPQQSNTLALLEQNTKAITEQASKGTVILFSLVGVIVLLVFLVCVYIIYSVSVPAKQLMQKTREVAAGKLDNLVDIDSRDELGQLASAFNQMTARLSESYQNLEAKIQERTQDLQKFRLAVESTSDHIIITDPAGVILYANKAAEKITGYGQKEMLGKTPALWGNKMPKEFYKNMWDVIKKGKSTFKGEINNTRKNGEEYLAEVEVSPVLDDTGKVIFFVGIERDVTHDREVEKAKTEFVSLASHQLRTPLTSIKWYTEELLRGDAGKLGKKQSEFVSQIQTGSRHMVDLVNKLLNVSRIELGSFSTKPETVSLPEIIQEIIAEFRPQITAKQQELKTVYPKTLPQITTDRQLLRVIIQNLISNAVKYTGEKGHIQIKLFLKAPSPLPQRLNPDLPCIFINVTDDGCGIPTHQQDKIFSKFFRADNVHTKDTEGTGLGLYMSKAIIEHIGGALWFESQENKGATFWLAVPLTPPPSVFEHNLRHELALASII